MTKARYFSISNGLRGAYMPDSIHIIRADTRKALKKHIEHEADHMRQGGYTGASKRNVGTFAAMAWRNADPLYPVALPLKPEGATQATYGLFVGNATRAEFEEESDFH